MATTDYYSANAYRSDKDESKVNRQRRYKKGWFDESSSLDRPWGEATDVIPTVLFSHKTPEDLRNPHEETDLDRKLQNESREDHECLLHAPYPFRIRAALISESAGRIAFYALTPLSLFASSIIFWIDEGGWEELPEFLLEMWGFFFWSSVSHFLCGIFL